MMKPSNEPSYTERLTAKIVRLRGEVYRLRDERNCMSAKAVLSTDRAAALEAENIRLKELLAEPPSKAQIQIRAHRLEYGELDIPGDIDRAQAREEKG